MRNVFDQYSQPENRVTHALACSLANDTDLLSSFLKRFLGIAAPSAKKLRVLEQRLPGMPPIEEEEATRRGLPDMWIHDDDSWCLLVESKIASDLKHGQLERHHRTAIRYGFTKVRVLAIDAMPRKITLPNWCIFREWSEIYEWLNSASLQSFWAREATRFLEIAETSYIEKKYMKEGNLTKFSGIPFHADNPYNYFEAKRVLKLAMSEFRKDRRLQTELNIDLGAPGRKSITGRGMSIVWDFLQFRGGGGSAPHLTFAIEQDAVRAQLSIPNKLSAKKRNLILASYDQFSSLVRQVTTKAESRLGSVSGYTPLFTLSQRHYPTQRSVPIVDGKLEIDMRTGFEDLAAFHDLKYQPQWLPAIYEILSNKQSNMYVGIGASFSYHYSPVVNSSSLLGYIVEAWLSTKPIGRLLASP